MQLWFLLVQQVPTIGSITLIFQVVETKKQASILESYLEQRGVALTEGYFSCKVVLPNPKLRYGMKFSR